MFLAVISNSRKNLLSSNNSSDNRNVLGMIKENKANENQNRKTTNTNTNTNTDTKKTTPKHKDTYSKPKAPPKKKMTYSVTPLTVEVDSDNEREEIRPSFLIHFFENGRLC